MKKASLSLSYPEKREHVSSSPMSSLTTTTATDKNHNHHSHSHHPLTGMHLFFFGILGFAIFQFLIVQWHQPPATHEEEPRNRWDTALHFRNVLSPEQQEQPQASRPKQKRHVDYLPHWIQNYVKWHYEQRQRFPGALLFTDPAAPKVLVRYCELKCGGLHDRLSGLVWDLFLANQTGRLLLLNWCIPAKLEHFLIPNELDWTVPPTSNLQGMSHDYETTSHSNNSTAELSSQKACVSTAYHMLDLFEGFNSRRPSSQFYTVDVPAAIHRANRRGKYRRAKVLAQRILPHHEALADHLMAIGETDTITWSGSFRHVFFMFFRPSAGLMQYLTDTFQDYGIGPKALYRLMSPTNENPNNDPDEEKALATTTTTTTSFTAVHCRVRHPRAITNPKMKQVLQAKNSSLGIDRGGLSWNDIPSRNFAITIATTALQCAQAVTKTTRTSLMNRSTDNNNKMKNIFFYGDSADLVEFVTHELRTGGRLVSDPVLAAARAAVPDTTRILSRPRQAAREILHIDRQGGHEPAAYYDSFVDVFVAASASCIIHGVGNYALLAAKLSGIVVEDNHNKNKKKPCLYFHQSDHRHGDSIPSLPCPNLPPQE